MSLECSECERDLRGGHDESCSRFKPITDTQRLDWLMDNLGSRRSEKCVSRRLIDEAIEEDMEQ